MCVYNYCFENMQHSSTTYDIVLCPFNEYDLTVHTILILIIILFIHEHPYHMWNVESVVGVCAGGGASDVKC